MKILIAPDSFKGSLSGLEVAAALARGLGVDHGITLLPLADGGDGSVEAAAAAGFTGREARVQDARGDFHLAPFAFAPETQTAVIEVAATCGLAGLGTELAPWTASTLGVGQALLAARAEGATRIVVALGGSASTDGGTGILRALGVRFVDSAGHEVAPGAVGLRDVARIDATGLVDLDGVELIGATDVTNMLTGATGAAAVFGRQKGLDDDGIGRVDAALEALIASLVDAGFTHATTAALTPGAGAAGGAGFGLLLLGARLVSGADHFLDLLGFDERAAASDLVITGEGRLDAQTAGGKLVSVVARRAAPVPVVAVVGRSLLDAADARALGLADVHALADLTDRDSSRDPELTRRLLERVGRRIRLDW